MDKKYRDKSKAGGQKGKRDAPTYDPDDLVLVTDDKSPLYDERVHLPVDEGLVKNIMFAPDGVPLGVIKAIIGRRNSETGDIEVVDGRQRVKAAREANKRLRKAGLEPIWVTVLIQRGRDHQLAGVLISANEHAQEDTPQGKAKKAARYIAMGRDEKEVAVLMGVSEATVKNMLRYIDAPAAVRAAGDSGKITMADAYGLARMEPAEAKEKLKELLEKAPRTPGKKRSKNAKKARQVMGRSEAGKPESTATAEPATDPAVPTKKGLKKLEDAVADAIAAWIEATWTEGNWNGAPSDIPILLRKGEWRDHRDKAAAG
jgi:ParB family transcriptional regulator, chromosome partitioning protein